ncbi:MAG: magnesium transporter [Acidobacteriaceae bacterium]|nr:magnesium transporter [Acidobacteriaceae bacterium]
MSKTQVEPDADELINSWNRLSLSERLRAFNNLPRGLTDNVYLALGTDDQLELIEHLPENEQRIWLRLLPLDEAADLLRRVPARKRSQLLAELDETTRKEVNALLAYKEDVAGGLMNPRFARVRPDMTVDEAIVYLRRQAASVDAIHYAYVLDELQRLLGVLSFRELFAADGSKLVSEVMRTKFVTASEDMDQEALARLFRKLRLLAIPVVDKAGRMQGIVTVDDIVDVVEQEASEDIQKVGGLEALDGPYMRVAFWQMVRKRAGWLTVLFLGEMLTATAMGHFEHEIARAVVLALFVPLIISSGGNSGSQATTLIIRAMALGEVRLRDWWKVITREFPMGLVLGGILGAIGITRILVWQAIWQPYGVHFLLVALTVAFSLVGVVLFGTLAGSTLPFLLRAVRLDPASASAPFVATLVDVSGLVIYFTIARAILSNTLLK